MRYTSYQPSDVHAGKIDSRLPQLAKQLKRQLQQAQRSLKYDTLRLEKDELEELAGIIMDFAVDIHNDIGIWDAYEQYNTEFFGISLPLTAEGQPVGLDIRRIQHLLWLIYSQIIPDLIISPQNAGIEHIANIVYDFLNGKVPNLPKDSCIKEFLSSPNDYGWDVKRKLVWLGTQSYMFRLPFINYLDECNDGEWDMKHTDDFICQECTHWSGLGAIDILAKTLDITESERQELCSWYERLAAPYLLESVSKETVTALNTINNEKYAIRMSTDKQPFRKGQLIFGSLTPWRKEWYWSGEQKVFDNPTKEMIEELKTSMKQKSSSIVCRYDKHYEELVRGRAADYHEFLMNHYGDDLTVFPDGLTMAARWEREFRADWELRSPEQIQQAVEKHGLKNAKPNMPLPEYLLDSDNGIAVFINPDEGKEIILEYNTIVSGMQKKGVNLTEWEVTTIREFIAADACSPAFVKRVIQDYGSDSVKSAFLLDKCRDDIWLDYILRCHKGHFYRKRYPSMSVL